MKSYKMFRMLWAILTVTVFSSCDDSLPKSVDISNIPAYYFENGYLDDRVKAINDAMADCSGGFEAFFWITDMHWEPDLNTRQSPLLIKYTATKTGINKVLNGGDTANSQVLCKNAITQLKNAIGSNMVYTVTGNHEINDASRYERPYIRVADELRGHNSDVVYGDEHKSYFYFDNNATKTRYIGLSSFGLYLNGNYETGYTKEQLEWFKNKALSVQAEWTIIIFTHTLYHVYESPGKLVVCQIGANAFIDAIDNYEGNGIIACVLMGHSHKDRIHVGKTGIPYIISACDRHSPYQGDIDVDRKPGTISEQHFETVVIDKYKRVVKLFTVGGKSRDGYDDDLGHEVDIRVVNY